jgi:hypothetical protein
MELLEFSLVIVQVVLLVLAFVWLPLRRRRRARTWEAFAREHGLRHEEGRLAGEYGGVPVSVCTELRDTGEEWGLRCVVRATVPGALPPGFLAMPRSWTPCVERVLASNPIPMDHRALDKVLVFRADAPAQGARLLEAPEVRDALLTLSDWRRQPLVEKGDVAIAHESELTDPKELHRCLEGVTYAARVLAAAEASWRSEHTAHHATR